VQKRRKALQEYLRLAMKNGTLLPGQILPTVRMLADQFQVSLSVANQAVQELADEGLVYTAPRLGTFVGQRHEAVSEFYLLLLPDYPHEASKHVGLQVGFETRITQLGGASLVLQPEQAMQHRERGELPPLAGVFNYAFDRNRSDNWQDDGALPQVGFASWADERVHSDLVSFDDFDGGLQATRHLIALGHRRIAYLAMHPDHGDPGIFLWSAERERGWRQAMQEANLDSRQMVFCPEGTGHLHVASGARLADGEPAVCRLIARSDITAVVAANDYAALFLFQTLRAAGISIAHWPAVVGFDNLPRTRRYPLTSFHLPWDEVGRVAADLLWQRRQGQLTGEPVHRQIPMSLIRRLTSHAGWLASSYAAISLAADMEAKAPTGE
jgi:DNA-binding LacI/PurR family transcriptional regulator